MFQAALHAPDHGKLEPYHFVVIQGTGLSKLESLLKAAVAEFELGEERLKKQRILHAVHRWSLR